MRDPGRMRRGQRASGLRDNARDPGNVEVARGEHVVEAVTVRPFGDDIASADDRVGVEHPIQPVIGNLTCGTRGRDNVGTAGGSRCEGPYRDRALQHVFYGVPAPPEPYLLSLLVAPL